MDAKEFFALATLGAFTIGVALMIAITIYLNASRRRLVLLGFIFSNENEWSRGKRIDFFTANFIISNAIYIAAMLKYGIAHSRVKANGFSLTPNLHRNENYNKLLEQFKFFAALEFVKMSFLVLGICGIVAFEFIS